MTRRNFCITGILSELRTITITFEIPHNAQHGELTKARGGGVVSTHCGAATP